MGLGAPAINTNQKREIGSGPPFVTGSANNGLSVDVGTGKIVLGNDLGDPLKPALLLSNREIPTGAGNAIVLEDNGGNITTLAASVIQLFDTTSDATTISPAVLTLLGNSSVLPEPNIAFQDAFDGSEFDAVMKLDRFELALGGPALKQFKATKNWQISHLDIDYGDEIFNVGNGMAVIDEANNNNIIDLTTGIGGGSVVILLPDFVSFHGSFQLFDNTTLDKAFFGYDEITGLIGFDFEFSSLAIDGQFLMNRTTGKWELKNQNSDPGATVVNSTLQVFGSIATEDVVTGLPGVWKLGQFEAGAVVPTDGIRVNIDGVDYLIPAKVA